MNDARESTIAGGRLEIVDSLRGFALFGVFWANLFNFRCGLRCAGGAGARLDESIPVWSGGVCWRSLTHWKAQPLMRRVPRCT
jgi:uncharacterized membrane protein YeiB